tara:strand:- start:107 stop:385 length:279 start_codon:yes stop_codon:yes gene_type:complete
MNKSGLILKLQESNDFLSKNDIEDSLNVIVDYISDSLSKGDRVEIRGFGSFSSRKRKKRLARNPQTGKSISVPEKYHPYFRASKALKEVLKN